MWIQNTQNSIFWIFDGRLLENYATWSKNFAINGFFSL